MDAESGDILRDLSKPQESVTIASGGAGGRGNANALEATPGLGGQRRLLRLELKLIADIGLLGFPNAGKSSLLLRISTARPKVAAYPFTTRYPVLGVVSVAERRPFVVCDIPGLIEGAHAGKGLGFQFLRHIERTRVLVHMVDLSGADGRDPVAAWRQLNEELAAYSPQLAEKPQLLAANKMDLPQAREALKRFEQETGVAVWPISCATGDGVAVLLHAMADALK
jgi:GTP-binding protein